MSKKYCGLGPVPKGAERADAEYCLKTNQVRFYGIKKVDPSLVYTIKEKAKEESEYKLQLSKYHAMKKRMEKILTSRDIFKERVKKAKREGVRDLRSEEMVESHQKEGEKLLKKFQKQERLVNQMKVMIDERKKMEKEMAAKMAKKNKKISEKKKELSKLDKENEKDLDRLEKKKNLK
jgi:hypothetical protein